MGDNDAVETHLQELRRGTVVLACLQLLRVPGYGYGLLEALDGRGFSTDANTLYPLLRRLEEQGLLQSEWSLTESRPRRYYRINATGQAVLETLTQEWQSMVAAMHRLLQEQEEK